MRLSATAFFCELILVQSWNMNPKLEREDMFASALVSIIHQFYVKEAKNIFVTSDKADPTHNSILQKMFSALDIDIGSTWILHDRHYLNGNIDRYSNIILINSYKSFRSIFKSITTTSFESFGYYTIVETNSVGDLNSEHDLVNIFRDLWQNNIVNANILTYSNVTRPSILMHTYFPFAPNYCGKIVPVVWNSFDNGYFVQSNKQIFPSKTENLFQCPISILVAPISPYICTTESDGFDGIEYYILDELSKRLNFKLNMTVYTKKYLGEFYGFNGSAGGAFGMVLERKHDVLVGGLIYEPYLKRIISSTVGYLYDDLLLVLPNPREYTSFETLFFPFTTKVWITIASTLALAVTAIKLLQRNGKCYYVIAAGQANSTPYLNLLRVFLTASAPYKPKKNFARFLLMVWILASFVLQNVYQGQLFYFIKSRKMVESAKNIDELVEKGFIIKLVDDNYGTFLTFDGRLHKLLKPVNPIISEWEYVTETESYITFAIRLNYDTQRKRDKLQVSHQPKTIKIASYVHIFDLSKRFYLKNSMDEKIIYMNENGLTSKWGAITYSDTSSADEKNNPRQLNIAQILGVVQVWSGLLMLAIIVFISEVIYSRGIKRSTRQVIV